MEGHHVGSMLLDGHKRAVKIEAQLVGEPLTALHHQLRIGGLGQPHRAERPGAEAVPRRKGADADDGGEL
jgi:hypothetical protein